MGLECLVARGAAVGGSASDVAVARAAALVRWSPPHVRADRVLAPSAATSHKWHALGKTQRPTAAAGLRTSQVQPTVNGAPATLLQMNALHLKSSRRNRAAAFQQMRMGIVCRPMVHSSKSSRRRPPAVLWLRQSDAGSSCRAGAMRLGRPHRRWYMQRGLSFQQRMVEGTCHTRCPGGGQACPGAGDPSLGRCADTCPQQGVLARVGWEHCVQSQWPISGQQSQRFPFIKVHVAADKWCTEPSGLRRGGQGLRRDRAGADVQS